MERFLAAADRLCLTSSVALDATGAVELEEETEQVFGIFEAVELVFGEDARSCPGHVHVTSRRVVWSSMEKMFQALCDCAALNPDSENEGEGDFYFDEAEVMAGLDPATRAALMAQQLQGGMALEDCAEGLEGGDGGLEQVRRRL
ncbi:predicted protein, partial [Haematococcus lacustris]